MRVAFRCSIKQANCQLAIQQKQQETLLDKHTQTHTHLSHLQPWNKVRSQKLCVCVSICLLCVSHLWGWIMCLCMCVCVWRPVETVITATGWGPSETACCSSSCHYRSSTSSLPATNVWGLSSNISALCLLLFFFCSYIFCLLFLFCHFFL